jgi:hypothetical protein
VYFHFSSILCFIFLKTPCGAYASNLSYLPVPSLNINGTYVITCLQRNSAWNMNMCLKKTHGNGYLEVRKSVSDVITALALVTMGLLVLKTFIFHTCTHIRPWTHKQGCTWGQTPVDFVYVVPERLFLTKLFTVLQDVETLVPNNGACRKSFPSLHYNNFIYNTCRQFSGLFYVSGSSSLFWKAIFIPVHKRKYCG